MDDGFTPTPFSWIEEGTTQAPPKKRKYMKKKRQYVGWASSELITFLESLGKDITKPFSQQDITSIINQYVHENNLVNSAKKKRINCDQKLQSLFGRKQSIARNKIYDLLDSHLAENQINSDRDQSENSDENYDDFGGKIAKKLRVSTSEKKTQPKKKVPEILESSLAAINGENVKLVFLRKSLVVEMMKDSKTFESKVVGSFVRVKSDPYDIFQKNSHELHCVTGVIDVASIGDKKSKLLQISRMSDNINISELSDENFSEEEIEDLCKRVKDGLVKQPTVGELRTKVAVLHADITKHWLAKELVLLKNLIDRANEKGWRYKVAEYSDRRKLLESPGEQSRLLSEIPNVIPEEVKPDTIYENALDDSPKALDWDCEPFDDLSTNGVAKKVDRLSELNGQGAAEIHTRSNGDAYHSSRPEETNELGTTFMEATNNGHDQLVGPKESEAQNNNEGMIKVAGNPVESNGHTRILNLNNSNIQNRDREESNGDLNLRNSGDFEKDRVLIDLSDDDHDHDDKKNPSGVSGNMIPRHNPEQLAWYYLDPSGRVQGPFSLMSLKRWNDFKYFPPDFKVWFSGQSPKEAVLLSGVLQYFSLN